MNQLLFEMIPLGLAAAVSPTLLSVTVLILSSKRRPQASAAVFLLGAALAIVVITILLIGAGGKAVSAAGHTSPVQAGIDVALGVLLAGAGIRRALKPPKPKEQKVEPQAETSADRLFAKYLVFGIGTTLTNFSSLIFVATAAREIVAARLRGLDEVLDTGVIIFFYLLPITLPLFITLIAPAASTRALDALNSVLNKYSNYIIAAIAFGFGVYLLARGIPVLF